MEFVAFPKIKRLDSCEMTITQKIHGTNAHIMIYEATIFNPLTGEKFPKYIIRAASRTRWIYPEHDNYGFAQWVEANKEELIEKLGPGRHDGEWAGSGINSGEGFEKGEKVFVLFDWWEYPVEIPLPKGCVVVPVLYNGPMDLSMIQECMNDLKTNGSKLKAGFMKPEGVVITLGGVRYKKVFDPEEVAWKSGDPNKVKVKKAVADYNHLCQPIRLEKLLSKDEQYMKNYPKSLATIVKDYVEDLIEEGQISGDEDQIKAIKKGASSQIFNFVRTVIEESK